MRISICLLLWAASAAWAQLPDGPGRAQLEKMCKQCHELARSISLRQDRDGWSTTMAKMTAFGMKAGEQDVALVLDYLAKYYPAEDVPKVNVNKARPIELEAGLSLRRSQAAQLIAWREQHGDFKSLDDLKKVPSIPQALIDSHKDRIAF
jgi:competence ComEA-like helix-hairpin-helix protein